MSSSIPALFVIELGLFPSSVFEILCCLTSTSDLATLSFKSVASYHELKRILETILFYIDLSLRPGNVNLVYLPYQKVASPYNIMPQYTHFICTIESLYLTVVLSNSPILKADHFPLSHIESAPTLNPSPTPPPKPHTHTPYLYQWVRDAPVKDKYLQKWLILFLVTW